MPAACVSCASSWSCSHALISIQPPIIQGFRLSDSIGSGAFSKVYRGIHVTSQEFVAVKVIPYSGGQLEQKIVKEVKMHRILHHANVLEVLGTDLDEDGTRTKVWGPAFFILLEFASGGDLFDKIAPDYGVSEEIAHFFFRQLMAGVEYCHAQGICHRDLKPENLLIDGHGNLKISDFGLCSLFKHKGQQRKLNDACGSPPYAAPELALRKPYEAEPIDIWSAGVVLFTLLVGNTPWDQPTSNSPEFEAYLSGELLRHDPWNRISKPALSILTKMLRVDPLKRPTIRAIKNHPWVDGPNRFLDTSTGLCSDPPVLAKALMDTLIQHGCIEAPSAESEDHLDAMISTMDLDMLPPASMPMSQSQQPRSQAACLANGTQVEAHAPFKGTVTGQSKASRAAPSQRLDTSYHFFVSVSPLAEIYNQVRAALTGGISHRAETEDLPLLPQDLPANMDAAWTKDGFKTRFGTFDRRRQRLVGWVAVFRDLSSPLIRDLKPEWTRSDEVEVYVVKFFRTTGDPTEFRRLYQEVKRCMPAGLICAA